MYQIKLYTCPEEKHDFDDGITFESLKGFRLLSQTDYTKLSEILDIFDFIDSREVRQELKAHGHYITARNDMFLSITRKENTGHGQAKNHSRV